MCLLLCVSVTVCVCFMCVFVLYLACLRVCVRHCVFCFHAVFARSCACVFPCSCVHTREYFHSDFNSGCLVLEMHARTLTVGLMDVLCTGMCFVQGCSLGDLRDAIAKTYEVPSRFVSVA